MIVANKEVVSLFFLLFCVFAWLDRSPFGGGSADQMAISAMPANPHKAPHPNGYDISSTHRGPYHRMRAC